jgi:hypothetical protein
MIEKPQQFLGCSLLLVPPEKYYMGWILIASDLIKPLDNLLDSLYITNIFAIQS